MNIAPIRYITAITPRLAAVVLLASLLLGMTGCEVGRFLAYAVAGDGEKTVVVKAQYVGLENKTFAVLVAADEHTSFSYPTATANISAQVSSAIATNIPNAKPMDPRQVATFQKENPYWNTVPYDQLLSRLKVDRLIVVDIVEYTLHEPGNEHIWQGQLVANVGVAEAQSPDGNRLDFAATLKSRFPDISSRVGILNSSDRTIELGLIADFSMRTANLFRDHEEITK